MIVIDAGKYDRHLRKEVVGVLGEQIQGGVIKGDDQVGRTIAF